MIAVARLKNEQTVSVEHLTQCAVEVFLSFHVLAGALEALRDRRPGRPHARHVHHGIEEHTVGGYSFYSDLLDWCVWWLAIVIGAFAVRMRRVGVLRPLFAAEVAARYGNAVEPLVTPFENDATAAIGQAVKHAPHFVQASSMSSTRPASACSNPVFCMTGMIA